MSYTPDARGQDAGYGGSDYNPHGPDNPRPDEPRREDNDSSDDEFSPLESKVGLGVWVALGLSIIALVASRYYN